MKLDSFLSEIKEQDLTMNLPFYYHDLKQSVALDSYQKTEYEGLIATFPI